MKLMPCLICWHFSWSFTGKLNVHLWLCHFFRQWACCYLYNFVSQSMNFSSQLYRTVANIFGNACFAFIVIIIFLILREREGVLLGVNYPGSRFVSILAKFMEFSFGNFRSFTRGLEFLVKNIKKKIQIKYKEKI